MSREHTIETYFTNISLDINYPSLYYVRNSIFQSINSSLHLFKGDLLDVGCGIMPYKETILNKNRNVKSYTGLDFENSLDPEYALGKPDFFWEGDIIPFEENSMDTIMATEVFEHCPNPEIVMIEMLRVLRPGGVLFFTIPFLWNLHLVPHDEYRYTPFSIKRHLSNSGFSNIELTALGGLDASLAQMLGIWLQGRPLSKLRKKYISYFVMKIMKKLINADSKANMKDVFNDGSMITGIYGIAYKK